MSVLGTGNNYLRNSMSLSITGTRWSKRSSIVNLMADLSEALIDNPSMIFMGGGNPAKIPQIEQLFHEQFGKISKNSAALSGLLGFYQSPQGNLSFRKTLAKFLAQTQNWMINEDNIAVVSGSQTAFYILFNMYAGQHSDGSFKTIHLPLSPEYVGYKEIGINKDIFSASKPKIKKLNAHEFKYFVDFNSLAKQKNIGAIALSRPNNPTGNVITDEELGSLNGIAQQKGIPLIIDGAYGLPFPNMINVKVSTFWNDNTVLVLSLSKLGLPGVRCGIVIAKPEIVHNVSNAATALNLASSNLGPLLLAPLLQSGQLTNITQYEINPYYRHKATLAQTLFSNALSGLPYRIHKPEGAMFLWIWFEGLPVSSHTLYQRLKKRGVLIVPGEDFFVGVEAHWQHTKECIRVSYAQDDKVIEAGVHIIADEVKTLYARANVF